MIMDRTTLARNLGPLERQGLISITVGKDRREKKVGLTPTGQKVLEEALNLWEEVQNRMIEKLGEDRFRRLLKDLSVLHSILPQE
jgi:DNA-binding MarR family transcriptional regulator